MTWHNNLWALTGSTYSIYLLNYSWCCFWYFFRRYPPTTFYRSSYFLPDICVGSYYLRLFLIAGLESYSVSCSISINCNLIVPLLINPLIFERSHGEMFSFFLLFSIFNIIQPIARLVWISDLCLCSLLSLFLCKCLQLSLRKSLPPILLSSVLLDLCKVNMKSNLTLFTFS